MKASPSLLFRVSIYVTSAAILSILINLFANVFLDRSLNSTVYYGFVIALAVASIVFGILQLSPRFSVFSRTDDKQPAYLTTLDDSHGVRSTQASDVAQVNPTIHVEALTTQQQGAPVKIKMEFNGTQVTIESPDVAKIEDIVQHLTQSIQASNVAEAKASEMRVNESKETYRTESDAE